VKLRIGWDRNGQDVEIVEDISIRNINLEKYSNYRL
jgi:hypothetical protein